MKYFDNVGEFTEEEKRMFELLDMCKDKEVFECCGRYYMANKTHVVKTYLKLNPSQSFNVWLQNNIKEVSIK